MQIFKKNCDAVFLTGFVFGLLSSTIIPFFTDNPNRLMPGKKLSLFDISPFYSIILILLLCGAFVFEQIGNRKRLHQLFYVIFIFSWFVFMIFSTGTLASAITNPDNTMQRIVLSMAFWLSIFSFYIMLFYKRRFLKQNKKILITLFIALFAIIILFFNLRLFKDLSLAKELSNNSDRFVAEAINHLKIAFTAVGWGIVIGIPLAIWASKNKTVEKAVLPFVKLVQTIPSLSMFGLLIPPLSFLAANVLFLREAGLRGIGQTPAIIALSLYALLPIVQNTYTGLKQVDKGVLDAAEGMGMSHLQKFFSIELPIALPMVLTGVRTSLVQITGNTTMAALIGAGGLGVFIFQGLGQGAMDLVLLGALPIIVLAIILDSVMNLIQTITQKMLLLDKKQEYKQS
ncbi:MAG: ABC transporter permease [Thermotogota bacterium]